MKPTVHFEGQVIQIGQKATITANINPYGEKPEEIVEIRVSCGVLELTLESGRVRQISEVEIHT